MLVRDIAHEGVAEEWKGVMLAQRIKRNRPLDDLAELTVGTAVAFCWEGGDQLGITLIALGRVEHRVQIAHRRFRGAGGVERHAQGPKDFRHVALEAFPVSLANAPRLDTLPIAILEVLVTQAADHRRSLFLGHQFGCRVSGDRRTSICPFCLRTS